MKSTVETLSPTRVRLAVEVPLDELQPSLDKAYKSIAKQVRVPGFRPGKVPAAIIDQRVGRGTVLQEAVQDAVPRAYAEALRSNAVRPLGQPQFDVTRIDQSEGLAFTAEVDVRPEVSLPELSSLTATVDDMVVTDDEVAERVAVLREKFAMLRTVERPARTGDYVTLDLTAWLNHEELESRTGLSYEVGSGQLVDGLDEVLVGMEEGQEEEFETELAGGEHAGEVADVAVTVRSVREKELPELDDDFAQSASEFDTLEELRADFRGKLERVKRLEQDLQARDRVLEALVASVEVPLPESVVAVEQDWRRESLDQHLTAVGATLAQYLDAHGQNEEELAAELRSDAEKEVKVRLVLDAVADAEQIGVSDEELTEHMLMQAQRYGVSPEELLTRMSESGNVASLVAEVRRSKALAAALEAATVTDASGRPVELPGLRRGEAVGEDGRSAPEPGGEDGEDPAGPPADA